MRVLHADLGVLVSELLCRYTYEGGINDSSQLCVGLKGLFYIYTVKGLWSEIGELLFPISSPPAGSGGLNQCGHCVQIFVIN